MGLDMYLHKRTYVKQWAHIPPEKQYLVIVTRGGQLDEGVKSKRITEVVEEIGYWRKANAIHAWFVQNAQGGRDECQDTYVDRSTLALLLAAVDVVLVDHEKAEELLPTQSGFFFGGTEYDEYYFEELLLTKAILEAALAEQHDVGDIYYRASW